MEWLALFFYAMGAIGVQKGGQYANENMGYIFTPQKIACISIFWPFLIFYALCCELWGNS